MKLKDNPPKLKRKKRNVYSLYETKEAIKDKEPRKEDEIRRARARQGGHIP